MARSTPRYRKHLDPFLKYELLRIFFGQSLFPFLAMLEESIRLTWNGLAETVLYEVQINHDAYFDTLTMLNDVQEPLIRLGQLDTGDVLEMQIAIEIRLQSALNHPAGTGALVAFRLHDDSYMLSDDWIDSQIVHRIDRPILLNEARALIQKIQAHLLVALAHEHPSVTEQDKTPPTR